MEKIKVLVIDDNPVVVRLSESLLTHGGYQVISAKDGIEGINRARQEIPDVILLDVILPEMHGFEVCKALKNDIRTKGIPIVIVTGSGLEDVAEREPEVGAAGSIAKPFDFEKLDSAIKKAMSKSL